MQTVNGLFGREVRCEPGEREDPTGVCERHSQHHYCKTCEGYYGVPHDRIHEGPDKHPTWSSQRSRCACRPCVNERAEIESRRGGAR